MSLRRAIALPLLSATLYLGCSSAPPKEPPAPKAPTPLSPEPVASAAPSAAPAAPPAPAEPASKYAKCEAPPAGMACVPGGPTVIGSEKHSQREKPRHSVEVSTFYVDKLEVTNKQYEECEKAKGCTRRANVDPAFTKPDMPAVPVTWMDARAYCVWAGKRLLTEAEWEKAARGGEEGRTYPWGEEPATCERAQYGECSPLATKPVGSFAPGPYGIYDMAGNGYEWVSDWSSACYDGCPASCGKDCQGADPLGPCAGAPFCAGKTERVLKGGSFRWDANEMRGSFRRFEKGYTGAHRLSARCASSGPNLATWPPLSHTNPPALPKDPEKPTAEELAIFKNIPSDKAVLDVAVCGKRDTKSASHCKEPEHFVVSNERKQEVWEPFIKNLGGGYAGVGSDQSYNFIANARSQWAWLFDYDPLVVYLHALLKEVILVSPTPKEFVDAFRQNRFAETQKLVAPLIPPEERETILRLLHNSQAELYAEYARRLIPDSAHKTFDWLQNEDHYRYIRLMHQQGRIQSVKGNLLTEVAMPNISKSARALGVPIRVFYSSNADDHWELSARYRENIVGLPFDDRSVMLRTITPRRKRDINRPWKYIVHSGKEAQRKLSRSGWNWTWYFDEDGHPAAADPLVAIGLPGRTERDKAK